MGTVTQKQFISLPLKFVFTDEGASALIRQNVQIKRIKMGDQTEDYGVPVDKVTPGFLQRMIMMDYISKIEVSGVEPVESRSDIIELSKLIVLSILFRNYAEVSKEQLLISEPVKKWNYANPSMVIDDKTQFKEGMLKTYMEQHTDDLAEIQRELLAPIYQNIDKDTSMQADEKENRREILHSLLSASFPLSWFVLLKFHKNADFHFLLRTTRLCMVESLKKSNIVEYCSLMLMELASNIVNLNIQKEAKLLYKTEQMHIKTVIQDPHLRLPVIDSLRKKNSLLTFSWKLGRTSQAIGTRGRFQVVLYDQDINYTDTRESIAQSKTADVRRFNLSEFYRRLYSDGNDLNLGIFYLSFLDEACNNMGIKFETMVNQSQYSGQGQTITTLTFSL